MWIEPKRGLDQKHEINASVFEARLLTCSEVPGDLRIFIAAPLMIQQVQKYPARIPLFLKPAKSGSAWATRKKYLCTRSS